MRVRYQLYNYHCHCSYHNLEGTPVYRQHLTNFKLKQNWLLSEDVFCCTLYLFIPRSARHTHLYLGHSLKWIWTAYSSLLKNWKTIQVPCSHWNLILQPCWSFKIVYSYHIGIFREKVFLRNLNTIRKYAFDSSFLPFRRHLDVENRKQANVMGKKTW